MLTTPLLRTHRMVSIPCLVLGWLLTFDPIVSGQEAESVTWNRFRGPNGSGLDASQPLPADMAPDKARWKLKLPGTGHSSPVIWGDHVFVSSVDEQNQFHLQAIHRDTGGEIWQWTTTVEPHPMHRLNKIASSTPTTDGKRVYVLVPAAESLRLVAIDMQGKLVWERDFGRWVAQHGFGTSAVVLEGKVIFVNSQEAVPRQPEPGTSEIIAVSSETGGDLWRTPIAGDQACYSVPLLGEDAQGEPTLFAATCGEGFMALDLQTGQRRWDMNPFKLRIVGSPILLGTQLICNNGSGGGGNFLVSVDAHDASHDVVYEQHRSVGYVPTLIGVNQLLFSCTDNGMISCWDSASGESRWVERVSAGFWSSPVSDGSRLYCLDKNGKMFVLEAGSEYRLITSWDFGEPSEATPAIQEGQFFVRTESQLFCFGDRSQ